MKKLMVFSIVGLAISLIVLSANFHIEETSESNHDSTLDENIKADSLTKPDIVMPTKVSRPGCEKEDRCYIPSKIIVEKGKQVTWINEDSAFHSVTSGFYDTPTDLFDSGHLDPFESYTVTFDKSGTYDYFCTLHPWMFGQVIVE